MTNFNDFLNEQMKDPEFKAEWDALDPEFSVIEAMLKARKESGLTQKQLSERTGIAQTDISKLERGNANPSLRTLQRLAAGMGSQYIDVFRHCQHCRADAVGVPGRSEYGDQIYQRKLRVRETFSHG